MQNINSEFYTFGNVLVKLVEYSSAGVSLSLGGQKASVNLDDEEEELAEEGTREVHKITTKTKLPNSILNKLIQKTQAAAVALGVNLNANVAAPNASVSLDVGPINANANIGLNASTPSINVNVALPNVQVKPVDVFVGMNTNIEGSSQVDANKGFNVNFKAPEINVKAEPIGFNINVND